MSKHHVGLTAVLRPEWGIVRDVIAGTDNSTFGCFTEDMSGNHFVVWDGRAIETYSPMDVLIRFVVSPDGSKCATFREDYATGKPTSTIAINGEVAYVSQIQTVTHLAWLDDQTLVWSGWNEDESRESRRGGSRQAVQIRCFKNGEEVTGDLDFEPVLLRSGMRALNVMEKGQFYTIFEDGSRTEPRAVPDPGQFSFHEMRFESARSQEFAEKVPDPETGRMLVAYRGIEFGKRDPSICFDDIEVESGMPEFAYSEDRKRVAYVGMNYPAVSRLFAGVVRKCVDRSEDDKRGGVGRFLASLVAKPFVLLYNPYFGVLYAWEKSARRYTLVKDDQIVAGPYRRIRDHFFTPDGRLVAIVSPRPGYECVTVDGEEGPLFQCIHHVRYAKNTGALTYFGQQGEEIYRVVVSD